MAATSSSSLAASCSTLRTAQANAFQIVFDPRNDSERLHRVTQLVNLSANELLTSRKRIDAAIDSFHKTAKEYAIELAGYAREIMEVIKHDKAKAMRLREDMQFYKSVQADVVAEFENLPGELLALDKLDANGQFEGYKNLILLTYLARTQEVGFMAKRILQIRHQENHDLALMVAMQKQQLEEEKAVMNRVLKREELDREKIKAEAPAQEAEMPPEKLEALKQENQKAIDESRVEIEKLVKSERLGAEERIRLYKAIEHSTHSAPGVA